MMQKAAKGPGPDNRLDPGNAGVSRTIVSAQAAVAAMIIPHQQLSPDALHGLIEEFVTRDGTDYGESEVPLARKVQQVRRQLEHGDVAILFDPDSGSCNIVATADLPCRGDDVEQSETGQAG
jgi:uncharacterized protein YheU (UPF0270 family)